jgi:CHAT domain-containing protein
VKLALSFLFSLALAISACGPAASFDSEAVYQDARMKLKRGEIGPALEEADRALARYPSEQTEWHWRFKVLKAEALARQGWSSESLNLLRSAPPAWLATADVAVRRKLVQGVASARLQQAVDATRFLVEAEGLARTSHPELLGEALSGKAVVHYLAGDMTGAEKAYREGLQVARKQKDPFVEAAALGGLGLIATKQEHYDESIDLDRAALQLAESVGAQNTLATVVGNIAWCYKKLGDFENALTFYKQAERVSAQNGQFGLQLYWLTGISNVYFEQHDYRSAENVLTQALGLARSRGDKRTLIEYLNALSEIALETGRIDLAKKYMEEASEIEQASAGQTGVDQSEVLGSTLIRARIDDGKRDYAKAEESLRRVLGDRRADSSQRWEAEARLAKLYSEQRLDAKAELEFRHSLASIESVRSSVRAEDLRLSFLSTAIDFYEDYVDFLVARHRPGEALQVAELSRARTLAEGLGTAPKELTFPLPNFRPQEIARRAKGVILFYSLGQKTSYLWAITSAKIICVELPSQNQIDPLVKSYRDAILSGRNVLETHNADGAQLYKTLVEPAKKLTPHGSRVIVLPDESLYSLNFETLLVSEPKPHFWIEDVTVSTASSLTLLTRSAASSGGTGISAASRRAAQHVPATATLGRTGQQNTGATGSDGNVLLVGNATQAAQEYPVLPQAQTEMERVQNHFPEQRREVLAGPKATATAFLASKPEKFAYIHFVTHGTASRAHPLDSAVVLSPDGDSYKLYARDIVKHPLSAYLVTVSACNGSGTRAYSGEGLVGLSWAFLRAGAHNVIAALWEVSDASTPQLMDQLYLELSRGQDPASALRMAKLSLLKSDGVFKKPFYWGPFQLYSGS